MSFNRSTLTPEQKHNHLLAIYEQTRWHCENFETIYQYLLAGECSDELIEEIYQTTEKLSSQGHKNILRHRQLHTQTILQKIHNQETAQSENANDILLAITDEQWKNIKK